MLSNIEIIAEVKTSSPFGYLADESWNDLFTVANDIGDTIAVHTDQRWSGSFELIKKAKSLTDKPILAKGIHQDDSLVEEAIKAGADFVLVVGRIPKVHLDRCIIEPNTLDEIKTIPRSFKVLWNSRDLSNGKKKKATFEEARVLRQGWLCQASFIKTVDDIKENANAILVGTHLIDFAKSLKA